MTMPLELVATGIRRCELREYETRPPGPDEVLVRSRLSAEKHGTDLLFHRGQSPFSDKSFDAQHGLFMPRETKGEAMVSGARLESVPYRDAPRWDPERVQRTVLEMFAGRLLSAEGLLNPRVPITQAAEAYRLIDEHPKQCVKLAVEYPA